MMVSGYASRLRLTLTTVAKRTHFVNKIRAFLIYCPYRTKDSLGAFLYETKYARSELIRHLPKAKHPFNLFHVSSTPLEGTQRRMRLIHENLLPVPEVGREDERADNSSIQTGTQSTQRGPRAFHFHALALFACSLWGNPIQAAVHTDSGIYTLTRIVVTSVASFLPIGPEHDLDADILERIRSQRTGFHARYVMASGESSIVGSPRNATTSLADIPDLFIAALLATEDARFFEHPGLDPMGTARAFVEYLSGRTRGASGITQQLIKNQIVGSDVTFSRKSIEASLAIQLEDVLQKDEILEAYLGAVWFGRGWGAAGAARSWFGVNWDELNLSQVAFLAGLLQGPALFNPDRHPERAHARRNHVLTRMRVTGVISEDEYQVAKDERLNVIASQTEISRQEWSDVAIDRWIEANIVVSKLLVPRLDSEQLPVIETTFDARWQSLAQKALSAQVTRLGRMEAIDQILGDDLEMLEMVAGNEAAPPRALWSRTLRKVVADDRVMPAVILGRNPSRIAVARGWGPGSAWEIADQDVPQLLSRGDIVLIDRTSGEVVTQLGLEGAVVVMNIHTGEILASIGGNDTRISRFDRTTAQRQPGSTAKAFVYLAAMESGWQAQDMIDDNPHTFDSGYSPQNFGDRHTGIIPFYTAFEISSNIAAVKVANEIGMKAVSEIAQRAGAYEDEMAPYLTSALGATVTSLRNLVTGYAAIGNGGWTVRPVLVRRIIGHDGHIWERDAPVRSQDFSPQGIEDMQAMMRGVILRGTAATAFRNHPVAVIGKTGTSQGYRDAVFVGMGADIAVGVWLGRDDNTPADGFLGGSHAAPVAARIFLEAFEADLITSAGHDKDRNSQRFWPPLAIGEQARVSERGPRPADNHSSNEAFVVVPPFTGRQNAEIQTGGLDGFFLQPDRNEAQSGNDFGLGSGCSSGPFGSEDCLNRF